jgi:alanyl aminopeptidase
MFQRSAVGCVLLAGLAAVARDVPPFSLNDDAVPRKYAIELTIDPDRESFEGTARIEIELLKRLPAIWLNAMGLTVLNATAQAGGRRLPIHAVADGVDLLAIEPEPGAGAIFDKGRLTLSIRYRAPLGAKPSIGPYRLKFEDNWYVFTTFTPNGARSAFPCFDQPRFKTPWEFSIRVPRGQKAFANSKAVRETDQPGGMKLVEFATTGPLPSEVIAFAVGPLETFDGEPCGRAHIPVRVVTPRGHSRDGEEAACATPGLLARLEAYTGIPYPYDKLDQVALPQLPFGAVENPGFITYRLSSLLFPPGKATPEEQRALRRVEAHEMAHQWFGDFVTQSNWEDVWLSEGFATWLSAKVVDQDQPAARRGLSAIAARERIMAADAGAKTRPVRVVMKDRESMKDVYSQFVYQKGAAVLRMLEGWLGEDAFRNGLKVYLNDHRFGVATTGDLAAALRIVSETDPSEVMRDFLDQTGIPVVRSEVRCDPAMLPRIVLEQTNYAKHWDVPVCWKTDTRSGCTVVDGRRQVEFPPGTACPAWVYPNANGTGYYRTEWTAAQLVLLSDRVLPRLTAPERLTLVDDLKELERRGRLDRAAAEPLLKKLASDPEPEIAEAAVAPASRPVPR